MEAFQKVRSLAFGSDCQRKGCAHVSAFNDTDVTHLTSRGRNISFWSLGAHAAFWRTIKAAWEKSVQRSNGRNATASHLPKQNEAGRRSNAPRKQQDPLRNIKLACGDSTPEHVKATVLRVVIAPQKLSNDSCPPSAGANSPSCEAAIRLQALSPPPIVMAGIYQDALAQLLRSEACALCIENDSSAEGGLSTGPFFAVKGHIERIAVAEKSVWSSQGLVVSCHSALSGESWGSTELPAKVAHLDLPTDTSILCAVAESDGTVDSMNVVKLVQQADHGIVCSHIGQVDGIVKRIIQSPNKSKLLVAYTGLQFAAGDQCRILTMKYVGDGDSGETALVYKFRSHDERFSDAFWLSEQEILVLVQTATTESQVLYFNAVKPGKGFHLQHIYRDVPSLDCFVPSGHLHLADFCDSSLQAFARCGTKIYRFTWTAIKQLESVSSSDRANTSTFVAREIGSYKAVPACESTLWVAIQSEGSLSLQLSVPKEAHENYLRIPTHQLSSLDFLESERQAMLHDDRPQRASVVRLTRRKEWIATAAEPKLRASTTISQLGQRVAQRHSHLNQRTAAKSQRTTFQELRELESISDFDVVRVPGVVPTSINLQDRLLILSNSQRCTVPSRMRVSLRCRPLLQSELLRDALPVIKCSQDSVLVERYASYVERKIFKFDSVFGPESSQHHLFCAEVQPVLALALKGLPCTIFAYGQTGTGKTFSLEGHHSSLSALFSDTSACGGLLPKGAGIVPRTIKYLFDMASAAGCSIKLEIMNVEIYKEQTSDLLRTFNGVIEPDKSVVQQGQACSPTRGVLAMPPIAARTATYSAASKAKSAILASSALPRARLKSGGTLRANVNEQADPAAVQRVIIHDCSSIQQAAQGMPVSGAKKVVITAFSEAIRLMKYAHDQRHTAGTLMNERSSRSHAIMSIGFTFTGNADQEQSTTGHINLVDLSGSENIKRSGAAGVRKEEASLINQGLLSLGRVIQALADRHVHVPFRESKLTRLLRPSLNGDSACLMLLAVSPSSTDADETVATMNYANTAKTILVRPKTVGAEHQIAAPPALHPVAQTLCTSHHRSGPSRSRVPVLPSGPHSFTAAGLTAQALLPVARQDIEAVLQGNNVHGTSLASAVAIDRITVRNSAARQLLLGTTTRSGLLSAPVAWQPVKRRRESSVWVQQFVLEKASASWLSMQLPVLQCESGDVHCGSMPIATVQACIQIFRAFDSSGRACLSLPDMRKLHFHVRSWALKATAAEETARLCNAGGLQMPSLQELLREAVSAMRGLPAEKIEELTAWISDINMQDGFHFSSGVDFYMALLDLAPQLAKNRAANQVVSQVSKHPAKSDANLAYRLLMKKLQKLAIRAVAEFAAGPAPVPPVHLVEPGHSAPLPQATAAAAVCTLKDEDKDATNAWWSGSTPPSSVDSAPKQLPHALDDKASLGPGASFWARLHAPPDSSIKASLSRVVNRKKDALFTFALRFGLHRRLQASMQALAAEFADFSEHSVRSTDMMTLPRFLAYIQDLAVMDPVSCHAFFRCFNFSAASDFDALSHSSAETMKGHDLGRATAGVQHGKHSASPPHNPGRGNGVRWGQGSRAASEAGGAGRKAWGRLRKLVADHDEGLLAAHQWLRENRMGVDQSIIAAYEQLLYQFHCLSGPFMRSYGGAEAAVRADAPLSEGMLKVLGAPDNGTGESRRGPLHTYGTSIASEGLSRCEYSHLHPSELAVLSHLASAELALPSHAGTTRPAIAKWVIVDQSRIASLRRGIFAQLKHCEALLEQGAREGRAHQGSPAAAAGVRSNDAGDSASSMGTTSTSPESS